ncbi:CRISPR-associated helicase Cas3' [Neosynechococcus sphagnicola]|uniref:CRISPR-associated helicase Cas3' n=1 Tax=Neosynechococcus sphagnicola TaxID=1501145 RepID=UPI000AB7932E|nr:CRISPR-associated helicase Cas3' [Neosynechococcus sphagnicola]
MNNPYRLLAKSYDRKKYKEPPDYALLTQHSRDVAEACNALAIMVGAIALANAGLPPLRLDEFTKTLVTNGWIQDTGKASSHFQEMLSNPEMSQLLRHEVISGLMFCLEPRLKKWIEPLGSSRLPAIWGAMGHHRKFEKSTVPRQANTLTVCVSHPDFQSILQEMSLHFKSLGLDLGEPPLFKADLTIDLDDEDADFIAEQALQQIKLEFTKQEQNFAREEERRFIAIVKAFGIAADVAASAVAKKHRSADRYSLQEFVTTDLSKGLQSRDLTHLIHGWAWKAWKKANPNNNQHLDLSRLPDGFIVRDFQLNVANSGKRLTLAEAGCGSGKSLAAYLWARKWCEQFQQEDRTNFRLFFCLPTTGTTTEHFKDYALESGIPVDQLSLTHSRSSVDLETMAETAVQEEAINEEDTHRAKTKVAQSALEAERDKIEALALWSTPLVVTTTDTVLGLMANARKAIYSFPSIMQSAIVFDEVHAFDDYLFGHLLVFIKNFPNLPVLLMTASLPESRRQAIQKIRPDLEIIPGPPKLETLERYHIQHPSSDDAIWKAVQKCLAGKGKVLWVRNRVDWANDIYHQAKHKAKTNPDFAGVSINVYHSRLRYKDRSHRHRQVIDNFNQDGQAAFLVATQVAEMSLDLSADLLITDIAPVPSLIQRMGRLNRRATPEKPRRTQMGNDLLDR